MGHDQLFKEFLPAFFRDFLELFCPDIAARLDFGTVHFLEKELFTDFPEGNLREADVVAEVDTQDGIEGLVLVLPVAGQKQNGPLIGVADLANDVFVGGADGAPIQVLPEAPNPRACGRALERVRARKEEIKLCPRRKRSPPIAIPSEVIENRIYLIPGQKVMLDTNLAELYGVVCQNSAFMK